MRTTRLALLTGVAAILLGGLAGMAKADAPETHVLSVRLPSGQVEQIRYTGDVPPTVIVAPEAVARDAVAMPFDPVFGMLDQITAAMDQQMDALFQSINALAAPHAGGDGMVPALSGLGVCIASVRITYPGNGQTPRVVSRTSGDCSPAHRQTSPAVLPNVPVPDHGARVIQAKAADPYPSLVHPVSAWQH